MLERNDQRVVILGATSGDTGSAALEGCRHSERVEIYISSSLPKSFGCPEKANDRSGEECF